MTSRNESALTAHAADVDMHESDPAFAARALSHAASQISLATGSREAVGRLLDQALPHGFGALMVAACTERGAAARELTAVSQDRAIRDAPAILRRATDADARNERFGVAADAPPVTMHAVGARGSDLPLLAAFENAPAHRLLPFADVVRMQVQVSSADTRYVAGAGAGTFVTMLPAGSEWCCVPIRWNGQIRAALLVVASSTSLSDHARFVIDLLVIELGRTFERIGGQGRLGHWEWHTHSGAMRWNDRARSLHGVPRDSLAPSLDEYLEHVHPDDRAPLLQHLRDALSTAEDASHDVLQHEAFSAEFRIVRADGSVRTIVARADLRRGSDDELVFRGTFDDVTAERRRADQFRTQQRMDALALLAGSVAHDFNNLLVGILGNASLAHSELEYDSPIVPMLRDVEVSAQRAADLTRQLLAFAGKGRLLLRPVDLATVAQELREIVGNALPRRVVLDIVAEPDEAWVNGDISQLRVVVLQLITNAAEALLGEDGVIRVRSDVRQFAPHELQSTHGQQSMSPGRYAVLEVGDTGVGMTREVVARMFDPFFTTKDVGYGLGLAAAYGIVRSHDGALQVSSTPGNGTTVRILLPLLARRRPAEQTPVSSVAARTGVVLLVDDDDSVRTVARRTLERAGFVVHEAVNGRQGLERFDELEGHVSLVMLDLSMPVMGGEEAMLLMRERNPDVRVLLSSGFSEQDFAHDLAGSLSAGFIQKPYTVQELLAVVQRLTGDV